MDHNGERSSRSDRYQRLSRAARNGESDSNSMQSLASRKRRPRQPRKSISFDQRSVRTVQSAPTPNLNGAAHLDQRSGTNSRAGRGSQNEHIQSREVAQTPTQNIRLANTAMATPISSSDQVSTQRMEKLEHENEELRKRLEQMEALMQQTLAMKTTQATTNHSEPPQTHLQQPSATMPGVDEKAAEAEVEQKTDPEASARRHGPAGASSILDADNRAITLRAASERDNRPRSTQSAGNYQRARSGTPGAGTRTPTAWHSTNSVAESRPANPLDTAYGPAERVARKKSKEVNREKPKEVSRTEENPTKPRRKPRGPRASQSARTSQEPTWTQVPVDAGYATPVAASGKAESIPTARSVSDAEMKHRRQEAHGKKQTKGKKKKKRRKINFYAVATHYSFPTGIFCE